MLLVCPLMIFLLFIPHNPIILYKKKLLVLIERAFKTFYKSEGTLYLACSDKKAFFHFYIQTIEGINFVLVRMYVAPYRIF